MRWVKQQLMGLDISIDKYENSESLEPFDSIYLERDMIFLFTYDVFEKKTYFEYLLECFGFNSLDINNLLVHNYADVLNYELEQHQKSYEPFNEEWINEKITIEDKYKKLIQQGKIKSVDFCKLLDELIHKITNDFSKFNESVDLLNKKKKEYGERSVQINLIIVNFNKILDFIKNNKEEERMQILVL